MTEAIGPRAARVSTSRRFRWRSMWLSLPRSLQQRETIATTSCLGECVGDCIYANIPSPYECEAMYDDGANTESGDTSDDDDIVLDVARELQWAH
jgi:hypothetical protein